MEANWQWLQTPWRTRLTRIKIILTNSQRVWKRNRMWFSKAKCKLLYLSRNNEVLKDRIGWTKGYLAVPQNNESHPDYDLIISQYWEKNRQHTGMQNLISRWIRSSLEGIGWQIVYILEISLQQRWELIGGSPDENYKYDQTSRKHDLCGKIMILNYTLP